MELVFNPRNNVEQYVSQALRFIHPYLAFVTYRFHVEKAREAGKNHCRGVSSLSFLEISKACPADQLILILYRYSH